MRTEVDFVKKLHRQVQIIKCATCLGPIAWETDIADKCEMAPLVRAKGAPSGLYWNRSRACAKRRLWSFPVWCCCGRLEFEISCEGKLIRSVLLRFY